MSDADKWSILDRELEQIVLASEEPFATQTIASARDLLNLLRSRCLVPELGKGYWSTFSFSWMKARLEVEVFDDHVEIYRFDDRRTEIWHEPHNAGDEFSEMFIGELPLR
jgi:hypothetical protein